LARIDRWSPRSLPMRPDRRQFLQSATGISALSLLPAPVFAADAAKVGGHLAAPPLPASALYDKDEEAYWTQVRRQFLIPDDEVYLNNGTVGSSPIPVLQGVIDGYLETEQMAQSNPEEYPIWGYEPYVQFRDVLAAFIGCTRDELALVRNATEANSYI